jgi:hypothetical protein
MIDDKLQAIRERMQHILESVEKDYQDNIEPFILDNQTAKANKAKRDTLIPWMLEEWRRISIPEWRKILVESIKAKDLKREKYARWMLIEILEDPEYEETN